jgi:plasmid stabilization system protein ParE
VKLNWSDDARDSLKAIRQEYNRLSSGSGTRMSRRVYAGTRRIQQFPEMGRVVPEYESPMVRELIIGRLRLWYTVGDDLLVIAVFHATRDTR